MEKEGRKNSRRAQSEIITTVLIILLVLAAVIIVWNVVKKTVVTGTEAIGTESFIINLEIEQVILPVTGGAEIKLHRDAGAGEINELKFVFEKEDGDSEIVITSDSNEIPDELETKTIKFNSSELPFNNSEIEEVSMAPVFGNNLGTQVYEPESKIEKDSSGERILDVPVDESLISWWKFNGDVQDSVGNNNGNLVGGANTNGNVLNLDGNGDYANISVSNLPYGSANRTFSFWAKVPVYQAESYFMKYGGGVDCQWWAPRIGGGNLGFMGNTGLCDYDTSYVIPLNVWENYMYVYNGTKLSVYANANFIGSKAVALTTTNPGILTIGSRLTTYDFNGSIDDVMIFNHTLSAEEIKAIYNNQKK